MADFYPRPPRGGRLCAARAFNSTLLFLSTPSARRATSRQRMPSASWQFLSTPSARRATPSRASRWLSSTTFLSTPSARRATGGKYKDMIAARIFLSTPSARRATRLRRGWVRRRTISIHALREEGDMARARMRSTSWNFYPRPPRGGRRWQLFGSQHKRPISIHALREEGDHLRPGWFRPIRYFYPRPPRGGRPGSSQRMPAASFDFYPRPPRGGRPIAGASAGISSAISIHALREEGDRTQGSDGRSGRYFYPRPPRGGRRCCAGLQTRRH